MSRLRVHCMSMSVDGFVAGPDQDLDHPVGVGGMPLHEWIFATRTFRSMTGQEGGAAGLDDDLMEAGFDGIGATIMGRNMFGPVRGPWPDHTWNGWWGAEPPFGHPVFVLTHHPRPSVEMDGGTVFHFVTDGIEAALQRATDASGDLDVRLGGGADTIRQYLRAGLVDSMHLAIVPEVLGAGEPLLDGIELGDLGYRLADARPSTTVTHLRVERAAKTSGVEHTLAVVAVSDLDAARKWYERLIGASPTNVPMPSLVEWRTSEAGWLQVFHDPERAGSSMANLSVGDLDATADEVRSRGIEVGEIVEADRGVRLATAHDPDGNAITLIGGFRPIY